MLLLAACAGPDVPPATDAANTDTGSADAASADGGDSARPDVGVSDGGPCAVADGDHDGHAATACGGDDCDDTDAHRYPGNPEVCDATGHDEDCDTTTFGIRDSDHDGHADANCCNGTTCGDDCDDARNTVFPGDTEACDGFDNDCDTSIDEGVLTTYHPDADGDGYGSSGGMVMSACSAPAGFSATATDCDDTMRGVNPGATELCANGIDDNCNGAIDESGPRLFFRDADMDGFGDPGDTVMTTACTAPPGYVGNSSDCDDTRGTTHLGATEQCNGLDDDCSLGLSGRGMDASEDRDGDMHSPALAACAGGAFPRDDCNDARPEAFTGAPELCNGLDDDCSSGGGSEPAEDVDGDMHAGTMAACSAGPYARDDCRDGDPTIFPGAAETCDGIDSNCSAGGGIEIAEDADLDMHAPVGAACLGGYPRDDCQDGNASIHPGATETCDGLDDDCSSGGGALLSEDADLDMHSAIGAACAGGFPADDCDDTRMFVHPGAVETCDRLDDDCSSGGGAELAEDADGDMHAPTLASCVGGFPRDDCDDTRISVYLGAPELCDGRDTDCSSGGGADPSEDLDMDMHSPPTSSCAGGYAHDDCDDTLAIVHPGAAELCDRIDDDCSSGGGVLAAEDADNDMHTASSYAFCSGGPFAHDDCNDGNAAIHPGAPELCDGLDDDCSSGGAADLSEDADSDMHAPIAATCTGGYPRDDCRDDLAATHPGASELCDRVDSDCSMGGGAELAEDVDGDMHTATVYAACSGGYPRNDCNDARVDTYGGATEVCDGRDNDCSLGGGTDIAEDADGDMHTRVGYLGCSGGPYPRDDCQDGSAGTYPGAPEICDRLDDDCSTGGGVLVTEDADADGHSAPAAACVGGPLPKDDCDDTNAAVYPGAALFTPTPIGPANGAATGSLLAAASGTLRPRFRWVRRASCSATFEVQLDDSCAPGTFASCPFSSPELDVTSPPGTSFTPAADLAVAATAPVGRRYYWRVRACDGACSGWSPVRYVDVGRVDNDLNGDGRSDVVAGSPYEDGAVSQAGRVYVYYSSGAGVPVTPSATLANPRNDVSSGFGEYLAMGDLDADGFSDLVVSAQWEGATREGMVFVFRGSATGVAAAPTVTIDNPSGQVNSSFGTALAANGDVNGDGYDDLAIGQMFQTDGAATNDGNAHVYLGSATGVPTTPNTTLQDPGLQVDARFGNSLAWAGDVNADGFADLVVGAVSQNAPAVDEGNAFVYFGAASGVATTPSVTLDNPSNQASAAFGYSVSSAGDLNADGYSDIVVGARFFSRGASIQEGNVFVYLGAPSGVVALPSITLDDPLPRTDGDGFGTSVAWVGDQNGDGFDDLLIGRTRAPYAFVYFGNSAGVPLAPNTTIPLGSSPLAGLGDVNADGYADIGLGAQSAGPMSEGNALLHYGGPAGVPTTPSVTIDNPTSNSSTGFPRVALVDDGRAAGLGMRWLPNAVLAWLDAPPAGLARRGRTIVALGVSGG